MANVLDALKIKWTYETDTFILSTGETYMPDFFIGNYLLIECKGDITEKEIKFHKQVSYELKKDLLLISYDTCVFFDATTQYQDVEFTVDKDITFQYIQCSNCNFNSFITSLGYFGCRECKYYNGDHDIKEYFSDGVNVLQEYCKLNKYKP